MIQACNEMKNKNGPAYDKWLKGMREYLGNPQWQDPNGISQQTKK